MQQLMLLLACSGSGSLHQKVARGRDGGILLVAVMATSDAAAFIVVLCVLSQSERIPVALDWLAADIDIVAPVSVAVLGCTAAAQLQVSLRGFVMGGFAH